MPLVQKKYKICLVSECLSTGGAERVAAILSDFFVSQNIETHHVIFIDSVEYSFSGSLLNLGKINGKVEKFKVFKKYIDDNKFDFIIDSRAKHNFLQEWIIARFIFKSPTIYTIHNFMIDLYFSKYKFLAKSTHKKAYGIVTITNQINELVYEKYGFDNLRIIHNPITIEEIQKKSNESIEDNYDFIVCAGRMNDDIKQFDKLILAYASSILPKKNIKLLLLGEGSKKLELQELAKSLNLENQVVFKGQVSNPFAYFSKAKYLVLSSKFEGLPMVILEALACKTPVIAFDCPSGPSEIIINKKNGLLIENQNFEKLGEGMNEMIVNPSLYEVCKNNSLISVQNFSVENIGKQWLDYLKINVS